MYARIIFLHKARPVDYAQAFSDAKREVRRDLCRRGDLDGVGSDTETLSK